MRNVMKNGGYMVILTIFSIIAGLLITGAVIVLGLVIIAVFIGIEFHNLLSMIALAGVLAMSGVALDWLLQFCKHPDEKEQIVSGPNNHQEFPGEKNTNGFNPWTDEWYGSGPWWKKW